MARGRRRLVAVAVLTAWLGALPITVPAAETQELLLGSDEWPPFTGKQGTERAAIDLVHKALERAGIQATTSIYDWKQVEARLRRGELHNNVRMTWGKAILNWTKSPQQALELLAGEAGRRFPG